MRAPESFVSLIEQSVIDEVVRPLMSGKEAEVFLVVADGERYVAKVYKEAKLRSFKHRSEYTEGRRVRNSRDQRAMSKHSRYGRSREEASWRTAEVDAIFRLRDAGVRVPEPRAYVDGVLVMELVTDRQGRPAPRLADVGLHDRRPEQLFESLLGEITKMLCAGLIHGDLSEFNVLAGADELVIIDFPQTVDAAANRNARKLLLRDVGNLTRFFGRHVRGLGFLEYGEEMWDLYERGELTPETPLTGRFKRRGAKTDVSSLLAEMEELERDNRPLRQVLSVAPATPAPSRPRVQIVDVAGTKAARGHEPSRRRGRRRPAKDRAPATSGAHEAARPGQREGAKKPRRSPTPARRRRGRGKPAAARKDAPAAAAGVTRAPRRDGAEATTDPSPSSSSRRRRRRRRRGSKQRGPEASKAP